jgi:hypothetical protein
VDGPSWLLLIASGASTTGLLRAPVGSPGLAAAMLTAHEVAGVTIGLIIVAHRLRTRPAAALLPVGSIVAAVGLGWLAGRSFAPLTVAEHAAIAAYAIVTLVARDAPESGTVGNRRSPRTWKAWVARLGFVLLLLQIALGALVRHQLMPVVWHVLIGGLAAAGILVPAVAITQESLATPGERAAARWAIASVLVQVALGLGALFMILIGPPGALIWVATTASHVIVGSLTLAAAVGLTRASGDGRS